MPRMLPSLLLPLLLLPALVRSEAAPADSPPLHRVQWPSDHPVWSLCWVSPDESAGVDGSGLELRDVHYKGKLVLARAGVPLINVDYDPGGCGSYRDWQHALMTFEADHPVGPPGSRYAEPVIEPRTMCDHPGSDAGDFEGVAAWKTAEHLLLITQLQAGPYRYVHKWIFHLDGTIDARIAFTSRIDPCNAKPHNHHAYWRLELGSGGRKGAVVEAGARQGSAGPQWRRLHTESTGRNDPFLGSTWRVQWPGTGRGYEIHLAPDNGVADDWGGSDFWVLAFHPREIDDGGAAEGSRGSAVQLDRYLDGERLDGKVPVVWVHATDRHEGSVRCHFVGPTLRPMGKW